MKHTKSLFLKTREDLGYKGPIKRFDQKKYQAKLIDGYIVQGEIVFGSRYNDVVAYEFDQNGKVKEEEQHIIDSSYTLNSYNEKGEKFDSKLFFQDGSQNTYSTYEYDENSNMIGFIHYDSNNQPTSRADYIYNKKGFLVKYIHFDKDNKLTQTINYINDENGNQLDQKNYKTDGTLSYWCVNKYNDKGHSLESITMNPDGSVQKTLKYNFIYDDDGHVIGSNGQLYRDDPEPEHTDYEFDGFGNWTCRVIFHHKLPVFIYLREISYHSDNVEEIIQSDTPKKIAYTIKKSDKNKATTQNMENTPPATNPKLEYQELEESQAKWLAEACTVELFPVVRYYAILNNEMPSATVYRGHDIEVTALLTELQQEMGAKIIHSYSQQYLNWGEENLNSVVLRFPNKRYLVLISGIYSQNESVYLVPEFFDKYHEGWESSLDIGHLTLYHPTDDSDFRSTAFEEELESYINLCSLEKVPDLPEIQMVEVDGSGEYQLKTYPVNDNFLIKNLDIHYGYGFETFHNKLMDRFKHETKGLVLFHGEPGTGKTYYIRHLLRHMAQNNKVVIYIPPNMVERLVDPAFFTFLSSELSDYSTEGKFCVLLVEDAEPLLASRQNEGRVIGVSNLLNLTDGLLNDMMKLQIICTFNVKIQELDAALLRPGRLIARKEFKAMSMIDANRLAQQLGIKHHFTAPVSIAEVYALQKDKNTLTHTSIEEEDF